MTGRAIPPKAPLTLYSKGGCPLCDELKDELQHHRLAYVERDITTNEEWFARYRDRIPVVVLPDGHESDGVPGPDVLEGWRALYG